MMQCYLTWIQIKREGGKGGDVQEESKRRNVERPGRGTGPRKALEGKEKQREQPRT